MLIMQFGIGIWVMKTPYVYIMITEKMNT